ncbi:dicarboxylate/amino acid:cation symporter [Metabacillus niabensis]|uniref:Na+/H+-dicarboxylate symporter n=1 Tax=Metabacillus niabensis TaxID=324854 RepID=A0ABT9Z4E2_9BACI|nr:dicarboxylate/amino acid:cation symporter [Metabacillus niabensis]MDQ0227126.1 Na+/H+-dicarboxylate symporter [Metabacillus niabensis]
MKFSTKVFIGLILGVIVGVLLQDNPDVAAMFKPIGDIFIKLIKMIMIPLVFSSLVIGITNLSDIKKVGEIGIKTFVYFMITTAIAVAIGLSVSSIIEPGKGMTIDSSVSEDKVEIPSFVDTITNIVPDNIFSALVNADLLQVIFFAVVLGVGIVKAKSRGELIKGFVVSIYDVVSIITDFIMKLTPIGVFGLMVPVVATNGLAVLLPLLKVIIAFYIAVILHMIIVYLFSVKFLSSYTIKEFITALLPAQLIAFTTCSSLAALPVTIKSVQEKLKVPKEVSGFVLTLGATINSDGNAIYQGIAVFFVAQAYGLDLSFGALLMVVLTGTLASIGAAGVPGAALVVVSLVLSTVGLPPEGIALIAGIDRILDMGRTLVNVTGDATTTVVINKSVNKSVLVR